MISYTLLEFDELISTSDFLKENQTYFPHMTIVRANHQTKGRGQFDRKWESNPEENLLFSVLLKNMNVSKMFDIKRWIVSSIISYLQKKNIDVYFKEPNDLYVLEQKLCGILIETQSNSNIFDYVIIGIGLNVNQTEFDHPHATSLGLLLNQTVNINHLFEDIIKMLIENYEQLT
ncbi:MAG: biotin--[acetyl-CoA-carboxylase] ligase [Acholeplasmataceae bacterium]|nr:biotin--[acetyl-CoA-carboxylase] ligase [Acholeplasmataceae bacterium]